MGAFVESDWLAMCLRSSVTVVTQTEDEPMETADHYLNLLPSGLLAAVSRGEIDLNKLAAVTLAGRGLDQNAKWVGFSAAAELLE